MGQSPGGALGGHPGVAIWPEKDKPKTGRTLRGQESRRTDMANPNRKKRTKEEWDKLTEQAAKNAAKRMQEKKQEQEKEKAKKLTEGRARYNAAGEKNPSKKITAAQAKEAAQDPTSAGAKAIREKVLEDMKKQKEKQEKAAYREAYNAPLAQMSRNSTSWSILGQGKDAAKKAKWPEAAVDKMTAKQDALHQKNVEIAKPYDITFDAEKGVWRGGDSYGEWKGAQVYDVQAVALYQNSRAGRGLNESKALPLPGSTASDMVAGARKVQEMAGQFQPNPAVPAAQVAENRAKGAQRAKDTLMWPVHQTMAAIGGVSGSLYDTANMALETTGIDKFLPDAVKNWVTKNAQLGHGVQEQVRAVNYERGGKLGGAVGDLAQLGVEMLGQYALAAATGGASAGAQLGAKTGMVSKALETIAKSPNFWYSFVRTAGPEYEEAKANGASGPQAATAAILSALGQAGVEMGGGVETLAGKAAGGVKGAVKSMLEEGGEEAVQDLISGLAHKGVYDKGRGWFGSGDSGAVVNPQRMAGEFAMGALGASLPVGVNALMNRGKTYSLPLPDARDAALPETGKQGLPLPDVRQEATSIDTNPETHTPEQMRTIEEYISSTDADFKSFVQDVTDGKQAAPYALKNVSDRAAQDIKAITGVDAAGFQTKIEPRMIEHIIARHGQNGAADSSMTNIDDIARMQYVIDHYDAILDGGKSGAYREPNPNYPGKTRAAKTVLYVKKVNGSYYVVEAVPDSKKKTAYISSAYMNKGDQPILNAPNGAPGSTSENASLNLPIKIVPQAGVESKASPAKIPDPGILRQKEMEQLAQDQLDALESDSFDVPDAEMRERTAQMAENKTLDDYTLEELDALVSESYVNQNADLRDRDQLEKRFGEKWEGDIRDIREMIEQADEQGAGTVIPPEIAVRLNKVRGAYNKTLGRVLDQAAGKDTRMREFLREKVEMPLASAKGDYAHGVKSMLDSYAENMQKYGIRMGSREDAAVMWYGEGQRVDEAGDTVPYTEADLKRDFPKSWQKIKAADAVNRRIYDDYIDRINEARAIVYPHAEERVKLEIAKLRARSAAYQTQIEALDARITKGMATPEEAASRDFLMQEMQSADQMANKKQADLDSGEALRGKRMPKRKDYYHHFQEMAEGFGALRNIMETDADIDPRLVGTSDHTRPNTKWQGAMQERITNRTVQSSIGAMLDYVPAAEFMIHIDPQIARLRGIVRDLVDGTADANQTNANGLIEWLTDYTNDIAGKTNPFDRALQKVFGRKSMKVVEWLNGRAKSNAILGNLNSAIAQWFNLPNGVAIIKNPIDLSKGMADYAMALKDGTEARKKLDQSNFMTERYLDESVDQFDKNLLHKPKQFATWLLTVGDKQASQVIWFSAYEQGVRKGVADPVFYADDITQRAVGGRGIGEVPLTQQSKVTKLLAPFQVEVNNQWQLLKQMVGNKDALGLTLMFLLTFGLNELKEGLTGTRTGMDLIDAGKDAWEELSGDEDASAWDYVQTIGGRLTGEVASNVPYGAQIAGLFISDENQRQKLFGESDPTRFGTGNIGIDALFEPVTKFANGETIDPTELITNFMLPWGGKQISRVKGALEDQGIVPKIRLGRKIAKNGEGQPAHIGMLQYGKQPVPGAYNEEGTKLKFALPTDFGTIAKSAAFGRYSLPTGREYIDSGFQGGLNAKNTAIYERLAQGGTDPQKAYEAIRAVTGTKAPEDGSLTAAQAKREAIMALDLTPEEKVELNRALVGGDDLVSFQDRDSFQITNTVSASNQPAAFALMREQGMDAAQAKKYAELVDDQGATYTLSKDQKITKTYEDGRQEERLLYTKDGKAARLKKAYETIQADESLTDGQKNGVVRAVVLSKLGKKYAGEYAEEFIGGIGVEQLIDAQAAYDKIYDAVQKDTTIHENNRDEYVRVRFADYLENTGLDFLRRESLWYFQSHGESEFKEPWSEIIRQTTPSDEEERTRKQSALRGLQDSGMDESLFKVIKAGMGRMHADKDANGKTVDGSAKKKKIAYLNKWEGLTDEQKDLIMKACGYKYGMGEKPKKGKSSSSKFPYALPTSFKLKSLPTAF